MKIDIKTVPGLNQQN